MNRLRRRSSSICSLLMPSKRPLALGASDRTKTVRINITSTFIFSTGARKRLQFPGCTYGDLPANNSGRDKFIGGSLDLYCDSIPTLL